MKLIEYQYLRDELMSKLTGTDTLKFIGGWKFIKMDGDRVELQGSNDIKYSKISLREIIKDIRNLNKILNNIITSGQQSLSGKVRHKHNNNKEYFYFISQYENPVMNLITGQRTNDLDIYAPVVIMTSMDYMKVFMLTLLEFLVMYDKI